MGPRNRALLLLALLAGCARELSLPDAPRGSPGAIGELRAGHAGDEVTLLFTAPSADGQAVTAYELRVGPREQVTPGAEAALATLPTPRPEAPGTPERLTFVRPLPEEPAICFVLRARMGGTAGPFTAPACLDFAPPGAPTLAASPAPEGRALRLSYAPPADADVQALLLVRAPAAPPIVALVDGALPDVGAAAGNGLVVAKLPAAAGELLDAGLQDGATYGYALVAVDEGGNVSAAATALGDPADLSAPPPAPSFAAAGLGEARVRLDWTLPVDATERAPLAATLVRRFDAPVEAGPSDGRAYAAGEALGAGEVLYDGPALSFTDAGLPAGATLHYALYVRDAAQNFSAPLRADAISVQGPAIEALTLTPALLREGQTLEISFALSAPPSADPEVTVGSLYALLEERPATPDGRWRFSYRAFGGEPEGLGVPVEVRAIDATGTAARRSPVVFDFTAPALLRGVVTPSALRRAVEGELEVRVDEALGEGSGAWVDGAPLPCLLDEPATTLTCVVPAPQQGDPEGPASVSLTLVDVAGNAREAVVGFERDTIALVDPRRILVEQRVDGSSVLFEPGALEPLASGVVAEDPGGAPSLGDVRADLQGGAPALTLAARPPRLWLVATDRAGNVSLPVELTRLARIATLEDPAASLEAAESGSLLPRADELTARTALDAQARADATLEGGPPAQHLAAAQGGADWEEWESAGPEGNGISSAAWRGTGAAANPHRVFAFGGQPIGGQRSDQLWLHDGVKFRRLSPGGPRPRARTRASLVFDSIQRRLLLFGGEGAAGPLSDLWAYDPATDAWTELAPRGVPPARFAAGAWFDPHLEGGALVVYGGVGAGGVGLRDQWEYLLATGQWRNAPLVFRTDSWELPQAGPMVAAAHDYVSYYGTDYGTTAMVWGSFMEGLCDTFQHYRSPSTQVRAWSSFYDPAQPATCMDGSAIASSQHSALEPGWVVTGGIGRERLANKSNSDAWTGDYDVLPPRRFHALAHHDALDRWLSIGGEDDTGQQARSFQFRVSWVYPDAGPGNVLFDEITLLHPLAAPSPALSAVTGGDVAVFPAPPAGGEAELWLRSGGAFARRAFSGAAVRGLLVPDPVAGVLLVQTEAQPARTWRATTGAFAALNTTLEPAPGRVYGVAGLDEVGTVLTDGARTYRFSGGTWREVVATHPLAAARDWRGLAADPDDGRLLASAVDGGTARWTGADFEELDAWPPAPIGARLAADAGRVRAIAPGPLGLQLFEWAGGGWVPRSAPSAPALLAPSVASRSAGGIVVAGDPSDASLYRVTAARPARLPHLVAALPLLPGPAPTSLRVRARVGGTGTGADGQLCHGALLALVDPAGGRALRVATTDAPADAPALLSATLTAAQLSPFAGATSIELVVSPRCAADALEARVALEAPEVVAASGE